MILAFCILTLEYPLPQIKSIAIYRSIPLRVVLLVFQSFLAILYYQGTNGAIWSFIALLCYSRAIMLGETMELAKENRGKADRA